MVNNFCCNTDEAATQQLRAWATEIFSYNSRILNGENHESEKGENKADDMKKKQSQKRSLTRSILLKFSRMESALK